MKLFYLTRAFIAFALATFPATLLHAISFSSIPPSQVAGQFSTKIDEYSYNKAERIINTVTVPMVLRGAKKGDIIEAVSAEFLGTPYKGNTLIGTKDIKEQLVVNFNGMDCFTYEDYVESLSRSLNIKDFVPNLIKVRYFNSRVNFNNRKHFFTDWATGSNRNGLDITLQLSPNSESIVKQLNQKSDGSQFLSGLKNVNRSVHYIPGKYVDDKVISQLHNGDYIGIYTEKDGLDVTHTGIYIKNSKDGLFRNASSKSINEKVTDYPFKDYMKEIPGIIVIRPLP